MPVPVLMYHAIGDGATGTQEFDDANFTVTEAQFRQHLSYLKEQGFTTLRFAELADRLDAEKQIVISFDDGHQSDASIALPILQEFGFTAEFFITGEWVGTPGFVDADGLKSLVEAGMGLGSHGHSHSFFNDMSYEQALQELRDSAGLLEEITSQSIDSFSAPGGQMPRELQRLVAECGIRYVCTSSIGSCSRDNFPFAIPRIAIRKDLCQQDFERIVNCDPVFYRSVQRRAAVLAAVRKTVGNKVYMGVREKLLNVR